MEVLNQLVKNFKNVAIILLIIGIVFFARSWYNDNQEKNRLHSELIGQQEEYEQLSKNVAKLKNAYVKQTELIERQQAEWSEIERKKDERIKLLSDATYLMGRHVDKQNGPDYYFQTKRGTRNYVYNEIRVAGKDSPPIGFVMIKNDGRTYKGNYRMEFNVKNLQTVDEKTGKIKVYSKAFLIVHEAGLARKNRCKGCKNWKDVAYPLEITGGTVLVDPTIANQLKPKFFFWNPKFGMSFNGLVDNNGFDILPALDISFMSYGLTKNDSKFKFLSTGFSLGNKPEDFDIHLKPILYRVFDIFPNTYIGPGVGFNKDGTRYLMGISVGF